MKKIGLALLITVSPVLLLFGLITGCAPTLPQLRPPENYKGPIAEGPILQSADYWVYERADGRRVKAGPATSLANLHFPLWVGKWWSYDSEAVRAGYSPQSTSRRLPVRIDCEVADFKQVAVAAGNFAAFECKCRCTVIGPGEYEPDCGEWTFWYAPQAKNIIRTKTQSTANTIELVAYDVSGKVTKPASIRRAPPQCLDPESRKKFPILCGS